MLFPALERFVNIPEAKFSAFQEIIVHFYLLVPCFVMDSRLLFLLLSFDLACRFPVISCAVPTAVVRPPGDIVIVVII